MEIKTNVFFIVVILLQSTGCVVYVVPESAQVDPVHCLAQLQVGDYQGTYYFGSGHYAVAVLLRCARVFREEDDGSVKEIREIFQSQRYIFMQRYIYLPTLVDIINIAILMRIMSCNGYR